MGKFHSLINPYFNFFQSYFCFISFIYFDKLQLIAKHPAFMYGTDVIPISALIAQDLDTVQYKLGKVLLGLPPSTANPVVQVELGWKPFQLRIAQSKLSYFMRVNDPSFCESTLVSACMAWNIQQC